MTSNASSKNCPSVFVSNDLVHLLKSARPTPHTEKNIKPQAHPIPSLSVMRMDELLKHVKDYILQNKLYDEKNPIKIVLNNELGSLLGKSEMSLLDVRDVLLQKLVFPVSENSSETICSISDNVCVSKRKLDSFRDTDYFIKRIKTEEFSLCVTESDESMHSNQGYETEFVHTHERDAVTSDDNELTHIFAERYDVDIEYEIESENGREFSCESDSDLEDFVKTAIINFIAQTDSDIEEYLGDKSSDDESERELSEEDKWKCTFCGNKSHPLMRCCSFCWKSRAGWLPERSLSEKKHQRHRRKGEKERSKRERKGERERKREDLGTSRRKERKFSKTFSSIKNKKGSSNSNLSVFDLSSARPESLSPCMPSTCNDSSSDVIHSQSSSNTLKIKSTDREKQLIYIREKQLCIFCCAKPADSTILHGKVGCQVCCFSCGQKVFSLNERCPVCRRIIERIVYVYNL